MSEQSITELTEAEKTLLQEKFKGKTEAEIAQQVSVWIRAFEGQDVSGKDKITLLTNPNNVLERSNYPTYVQLSLCVYLYLLYDSTKILIYKTWADRLSEALISYKGKSREQYVEMTKAATVIPNQVFSLNQTPKQEEQPKTGFFSRFKKTPVETESIA